METPLQTPVQVPTAEVTTPESPGKHLLPDSAPSPTSSSIPNPANATAETANTIAMLGDFLMVLMGLLVGYWIRFQSGWIPTRETWWTSPMGRRAEIDDYIGLVLMGAVLLWGTFLAMRLYDRSNLLRFRRVTHIVIQGATFWLFAYLSVSLVLKFQPPISRVYAVSSFFAATGFVMAWRYGFHRMLRSERFARALRQRVLFLGWSPEAGRLFHAIQQDRSQPYRAIGYIPIPHGDTTGLPPDLKQLGTFEELDTLLAARKADMVVLTDIDPSRHDIIQLANACEREHIQFKVIPSYFQILLSGLQLDSVSGVPILGVTELPLDRIHNRILKRTVDILGGLVGLLGSLPIILICGLLVRLESPGPIFYRQVRTGRRGENFKIIKIRSMRLDAEADGGAQWAKKDDPRRLRVGTFMRRWNLDEVPQFWNVLRGEMSLVGPRPERPELIEGFKYKIPHYNARHAAKPGITGWAQVNGLRGDTDLAERVRYDLWYLENWNLWLDFQIMFLTFFKRDNAY